MGNLSDENAAHSGVGNTTWHQDTVAVLPEALDTDQVTVWVAVTDASEENGCLASIAGSHLQGAHRHVAGAIPREPTVPAKIINDRQGESLPVKRGGIILFHRNNIHCSRPNRSARLRWSVDIRYHPVWSGKRSSGIPGFLLHVVGLTRKTELHDPVKWKPSVASVPETVLLVENIRGLFTGTGWLTYLHKCRCPSAISAWGKEWLQLV